LFDHFKRKVLKKQFPKVVEDGNDSTFLSKHMLFGFLCKQKRRIGTYPCLLRDFFFQVLSPLGILKSYSLAFWGPQESHPSINGQKHRFHKFDLKVRPLQGRKKTPKLILLTSVYYVCRLAK
jgi:hypothetical protein